MTYGESVCLCEKRCCVRALCERRERVRVVCERVGRERVCLVHVLAQRVQNDDRLFDTLRVKVVDLEDVWKGGR